MSSRKLYLRTRRKLDDNQPKLVNTQRKDLDQPKIVHSRPRRNKNQPKVEEDPVPLTPRALDGGYGWVIVLSSFVCNMTVDGIANSYGVFIDSFSKSFNEDKGKVALASSVNLGMHLLIGPLVGALCKRYSCRAVCIVGCILASLAFALSLVARNTLVLTLLYGLLGGTGFGLIYISTVILVSYYFELKRSLAVGISLCGSGFGTFVLPPLSQYLLLQFDWRGTHLFFTGFLAVCIFFSSLLIPLENFQSKLLPDTSRKESLMKKIDVLPPVLEDSSVIDETSSTNSKQEDSKGDATTKLDTHELKEGLNESTERQMSKETVTETCSFKNSDFINPINGVDHVINPPMTTVRELVARTHLPKNDILKILLFTRIVMKKDCGGTKLPIFSRRILDEMKSLQDMNESETLDHEVLDFYEIKKSKSEDLTLLQHYLSHVEMNIGESLPSDLNHYAYIVNDVGVSMSNHHQQVPPTLTELNGILSVQHLGTQEYSQDTASTRNVHSLPVLDQLNEGDTFLRETQSNKTSAGGINEELSEHVRFVSNLFVNSIEDKHNNWTKNELQPTKVESECSTQESVKEEKPQFIVVNESHKPSKDTKTYKGRETWWNSSSSARKDMYFTESICNLKEYQEVADEEAYRKRNTVQVSFLQDMWDRDLLTSPLFILFILNNVFLLAGYYIPYVFLVDTAMAQGVSPNKASFLMSVIGLSNMVGRIFFGFLDNLKLMDSLLLNNLVLVVSTLSILCLPYCGNYAQYLVTSVLVGFSQACVVCLTTTLLVQLFTLDKLTSSFGMIQMFRGLAIMIGSPSAGYIFQLTQSHHCIYWVSAGFYALSVVTGFLLQCLRTPDPTTYQKVATKPKESDVTDKADPCAPHMVTSL